MVSGEIPDWRACADEACGKAGGRAKVVNRANKEARQTGGSLDPFKRPNKRQKGGVSIHSNGQTKGKLAEGKGTGEGGQRYLDDERAVLVDVLDALGLVSRRKIVAALLPMR